MFGYDSYKSYMSSNLRFAAKTGIFSGSLGGIGYLTDIAGGGNGIVGLSLGLNSGAIISIITEL